MYSVYISRISWILVLTKFRTLQAVLEIPFFFFKLHNISAGHHTFFFIACNELTLFMDFGVQVDGSIENFLIIFCGHLYQISGYVPTVDSIVSIFAFNYLFWASTLESQSDCFMVLTYRWNYSIIGPRGCQNNARRGCKQNEGAAAAAAEPASAAAAPAEGAVAAAAPACCEVPAVSAPAPSPAWKGAGKKCRA